MCCTGGHLGFSVQKMYWVWNFGHPLDLYIPKNICTKCGSLICCITMTIICEICHGRHSNTHKLISSAPYPKYPNTDPKWTHKHTLCQKPKWQSSITDTSSLITPNGLCHTEGKGYEVKSGSTPWGTGAVTLTNNNRSWNTSSHYYLAYILSLIQYSPPC